MIIMRRIALLFAAGLAVAAFVASAETSPAPTIELSTGFPTPMMLERSHLETMVPAYIEASDHGVPARWRGVRLADVLALAGAPVGDDLRGANLSKFVLVTAQDGYRVAFSLGELAPTFGDNGATLVFERDGAPLSENEGPYRIVVSGDDKAARWIRQVRSIELLDAPGTPAPPHRHAP